MDNESAGDPFGVPRHRFQCPAPEDLAFSCCPQSVAQCRISIEALRRLNRFVLRCTTAKRPTGLIEDS